MGIAKKTIPRKGHWLMKWFACILVMSAFCAAPGVAGAADKPQNKSTDLEAVDLSKPLTLDRAIRIALDHQNTLGIAKAQLDAARARETQSKSAYFPQIAPTYQYSAALTGGGTTFGTGVPTASRVQEQGVANIGLTQTIFDTGKREESVLASKYGRQATEFNVLDTRQTIIATVSADYYELLRQQELVKVSQSSVDRAKTTLDATKAFAEAGSGPRKDVLQAEADYDNAQVQLIQSQNSVRLASTALKNAMGILTMTPITTPAEALPRPPAEPDTKPLADYVNQAFVRRLDLKRDATNIDASRHDVRVAQINSGFQVAANVTEGYRINPNPAENRDFVTSFSYPLFDAGATRAAVQQAKASLDQARLQTELTRQNIQADVESFYLQREEARSRIAATDTAVRAARLNYEAATASRTEGAGTIIDVITAQTALVTAETNAVQAIFDFYTADARLKRAVGDNDAYRTGGKNP